ncbi:MULTISPECIES: 4'-phosphopantetheinyl transferase family protein [Sinorhizobium]|uniref:Enterobactin synthase component D n=1 Tax=Sinorhizobium americanum TaxID=194963 RepID=A0A2S3YNE2_9HYPH|nr:MULTISPECIES: 4'-phosphopantetheinyl transferase superfamily protein [Sinorhizobium]PDT33384.1 4'-phosphopantetheinyl transferase [Sinorhizobium sp. FG01]PDT47994.1 4'-phosphopantetheinyl transferase [Sinorhizobium sp. NG07B]POH29887.1 4'-phosphopantetheinyl transferase [Sinorhizobium americanum]POH30590.1 4'-phosphopantetheinyl transferase [Sinorhizobium americanum]
MIGTLLPSNVAVQTCLASEGSRTGVMAEEESAIATAVKSRRREFSIGRACARAALSKLGFPPSAIPTGPNREPLWPSGVVGSITHCAGFHAAAVALQKDCVALGIDVEVDEELPSGVLPLISGDEERNWIANAPQGRNWGRLLFSAKESIFKAWFPLTGEWLGFEDAVVTIIPEDRSFVAQLPHTIVPANNFPSELRGRFLIADGLILTAVSLAASKANHSPLAGAKTESSPDIK